MRTIALAMLVFLVSSGQSAPRDPWTNWGPDEPVMVILHLPLKLVHPVCIAFGVPMPPPGSSLGACAAIGPTVEPCQIIMPNNVPDPMYVKVLEHEKAHCRGWEHGDPQPEGTV